MDYLIDAILLNRGRNRLDGGRDIKGSRKDLIEVITRNEDLAAAARTNLGLIYYKQGLYDKAETEFIEAIEAKPDLPHAYYNLGVLYVKEDEEASESGGGREQGKIRRAKKLLQAAVEIDDGKGDLREASYALRKIEEGASSGGRKNLRDWYSWWFDNATASSYKKALGIAFLALLLSGIVLIIYQTLINGQHDLPDLSSFSNLVLGSLVIIIFFLALPLVTHLKLGSILELEMESKGERPLFYAGPLLSSVGQT